MARYKSVSEPSEAPHPHFIQSAIKHPGALHKHLGVPAGKTIPAKKLKKAEHSSNETIRREANLAQTLKGLKH